MATCSRCGRQVSIWQRGLLSGLCRQCSRERARPAEPDAAWIMETFRERRALFRVLMTVAAATMLLGFLIWTVMVLRGLQGVPVVAPARQLQDQEQARRVLLVSAPFLLAGVGVFLVLCAVAAVTWRCPACGHRLGRGKDKFCSKCGVQLQ